MDNAKAICILKIAEGIIRDWYQDLIDQSCKKKISKYDLITTTNDQSHAVSCHTNHTTSPKRRPFSRLNLTVPIHSSDFS
jgi:hypothetical protein